MSEKKLEFCTPYFAAKLVNIKLAMEGFDKTIPPQMMYNYTKARLNQGKAPFIEYDEKKGVSVKSLEEWTTKYIEKLKAKTAETVEA